MRLGSVALQQAASCLPDIRSHSFLVFVVSLQFPSLKAVEPSTSFRAFPTLDEYCDPAGLHSGVLRNDKSQKYTSAKKTRCFKLFKQLWPAKGYKGAKEPHDDFGPGFEEHVITDRAIKYETPLGLATRYTPSKTPMHVYHVTLTAMRHLVSTRAAYACLHWCRFYPVLTRALLTFQNNRIIRY